jgi:hypothetical protein
MRDLQGLEQLLESDRQDVLSIALDVDPIKPDNQRANPSYRIWLRKALAEIFEHAPREQRPEVGALIDRVLTRVDDQRHGRGLAIFAASDLWREYVLPFPLPNRARYGPPDLLPLLWALDEYEPYAILAVSRDRVRLLVAFLGQIEMVDAEVLMLDTRAWRRTSGRPPTFTRKVGTGVPRGAQMDTFDTRVDEQERRFWRTAAEMASRILQDRGIRRLILAGPSAATAAVAGYLEDEAAVQVVAAVPAPPHASVPQLKDLTLPVALAEEHRRERELVTTLLERAGKRDAVVGATATLAALTGGRVQLVIADPGHDPDVWQCPRCGTTSGMERAECPTCGSPMARAPLLSTLPILVRRYGAELELVSGEAAALLQPHGSVGAILRYNPSAGSGSGVGDQIS